MTRRTKTATAAAPAPAAACDSHYWMEADVTNPETKKEFHVRVELIQCLYTDAATGEEFQRSLKIDGMASLICMTWQEESKEEQRAVVFYDLMRRTFLSARSFQFLKDREGKEMYCGVPAKKLEPLQVFRSLHALTHCKMIHEACGAEKAALHIAQMALDKHGF